MVIHSVKEIIETERRIIISLKIQSGCCEGCTQEAISYHEDIIHYMEKLLENEKD